MSSVPNELHALSADRPWLQIIEQALSTNRSIDTSPAPGTGMFVASVYSNSINIVHADQFLSLLTSTGRRSPGAMITSSTTFQGARPGARCRVTNGTLMVGHLAVDLRATTMFDCQITPVRNCIRILPTTLRGTLTTIAPPDSFTVEAEDPPFKRAVSLRLKTSLIEFRQVLKEATAACTGKPQVTRSTERTSHPFDRAVAGLIGLGFGLTPSGDDYLIGALAAFALLNKDSARTVHQSLVQCISAQVSAAAEPAATTEVSRHFLQAACRGEFHQDLAEAGRAILTDSASAPYAIRQAASIGSSSGADALLGLFDTLELLLTSDHRYFPQDETSRHIHKLW